MGHAGRLSVLGFASSVLTARERHRPAVPPLLETEPSSGVGGGGGGHTAGLLAFSPTAHLKGAAGNQGLSAEDLAGCRGTNSTSHPHPHLQGQGQSSPICSGSLSTSSPCCLGLTGDPSIAREAGEKEWTTQGSTTRPVLESSRSISDQRVGGGNPSHGGQGSGQWPPWGACRAGGQQVEAGKMGEALVEEAGRLI